jgi:hypothetical protein
MLSQSVRWSPSGKRDKFTRSEWFPWQNRQIRYLLQVFGPAEGEIGCGQMVCAVKIKIASLFLQPVFLRI